MKTLTKSMVCLLIVAIGLTSCEKFSVLKSVDIDHQPAGQNLLNKTIWEFLSEDNFHANDSTNIGLFGRAIEHAGLKDLLNQQDANLTVIIPTNTTLRAFLLGLGYAAVTDVPPVVLKNLLLNLVTDTKVRSFDLQAGKNTAFVSLSNDSLYLTRTVTVSNEYVLTVNSSTTSNSSSTSVRTQNLEFKNGVGHVVNNFTHYIGKVNFPDDVDNNLVDFLSDTIYVAKDTYNQNGSTANKNRNHGTLLETITKLADATGNNANFARRILTQFPVRQPSFNDRIGTVKLEMYFHNITGPANLNFYEDQNVDFNELTVNWSNTPAFGTSPIGTINMTTALRNSWRNIDISSAYISALANGKTFMNIGASITEDQTIGFRTKEFEGGRFRARIIINSPPVTIISPANNNPLDVELSKKVKALTLNELQFTGTANKNITYTLTKLPQNGFIVINGLPASVNSSFTQEQITKGVVKYLFAGTTAATDSFAVEAKDFQGGIYNDIVNLAINIR
jgi:hypothetical protein